MNTSHKKISMLDKIVRVLGGFLVSILVVTIFLKFFSDFFWAAMFGTIINGGVSYYILNKYPHNDSLRMTAYGAIAGTILMVVSVASLWTFVDAAFKGLAD